MIAVIFEAWPAPGENATYLELAAALRPELEQVEGFVSVERFTSLSEPGKVLSLSFWRDELAVATWRGNTEHRATQARGRQQVFDDYRLRIATVERDYGLRARDQVPDDSRTALP